MMMSCSFVPRSSIPGWLSWLQYISWFKYSNELLAINQWHDVKLDCYDQPLEPDCIYPTGESILTFYGFDEVIGRTIFFRIK